MPTRRWPLWLAVVCLLPAPTAGLGPSGWGPRIGVADDPDQLVVGLHADLGEPVDRLRIQPSLELGFGDDHTIVALTLPLHYRFAASPAFTPYAGGGVVAAFVDRDLPRRARGDDTEFELAPVVVGGVEWPLAGGGDLFVELALLAGDVHDAKLVVGWMRRR